jgi:DNA/RNA-binding domain of Phe-tRNA-synthetase-like protein
VRGQGPGRLVRAAGDEDFGTTAHGEAVIEQPKPGEVIWRDDDKRRLEVVYKVSIGPGPLRQ